jgi:hypothetical protein
MASTVRIPWIKNSQNIKQFDEVRAWAIKCFGPVGCRFHSTASVFHLDYIFESDKDALMMALMWNAPIVSNDELTVEFVGSLL